MSSNDCWPPFKGKGEITEDIFVDAGSSVVDELIASKSASGYAFCNSFFYIVSNLTAFKV